MSNLVILFSVESSESILYKILWCLFLQNLVMLLSVKSRHAYFCKISRCETLWCLFLWNLVMLLSVKFCDAFFSVKARYASFCKILWHFFLWDMFLLLPVIFVFSCETLWCFFIWKFGTLLVMILSIKSRDVCELFLRFCYLVKLCKNSSYEFWEASFLSSKYCHASFCEIPRWFSLWNLALKSVCFFIDVASYFVTDVASLWIRYYLIRIFRVYVTKLLLYYLHNHNYLFIANQYFGETDLYKSYDFFLDPNCIHVVFVDFCSGNRVYTNKICLNYLQSFFWWIF